jgi:F-type H+-transporting ATPase subunit b
VQIDWFTLGAQVFNFVLLAVLLWYVLYRPVRRAVDRREEEIESRVEEARKEKEEAEEFKEELRQRESELEEERDAILKEAREEADRRREEGRAEIREEMEELEKEWKASLRRDRERFLDELSERIREETFRVIRQGLEDLVGARPREAVREAFLRKARELPEEEREAFAEAVMGAGNLCRLRSALELTEEDADPIRELVEEWVSEAGGNRGVEVKVEVDEDGPRGMELWAGDRKMAWTVEAYVEGFRAEVESILESEAQEEEREGAKEDGDEGAHEGRGGEVEEVGKEAET